MPLRSRTAIAPISPASCAPGLHRAGVCHPISPRSDWLAVPTARAYLPTSSWDAVCRAGRCSALAPTRTKRPAQHIAVCAEALNRTEKRGRPKSAARSAGDRQAGLRLGDAGAHFTARAGGGPRQRQRRAVTRQTAAASCIPDQCVHSRTAPEPGCTHCIEARCVAARGRRFIAAPRQNPCVEHLQGVEALPRTATGAVRGEVLSLIAMNQLDLIDNLTADAAERAVIAQIVAGRRNLRDRFNL